MGLFGNDWKRSLQTWGAGLQDIGGALNHTGGGALDQLSAQRKADGLRKQQQDAIASVFSPPAAQLPDAGGGMNDIAAYAQGQGGAMPSITDVTANAGGGFTPIPSQQSMAPPSLGAQAQKDQIEPQKLAYLASLGVDIDPIIKAYQLAHPKHEYQLANGGDGNFSSFDPNTGKLITLATDPYADKRSALLDAQIAATKSLGGSREASATLANAKAKTGGFAPIRGRAGGHSGQILGSHSTAGLTLEP